jgi:hypothetical protein
MLVAAPAWQQHDRGVRTSPRLLAYVAAVAPDVEYAAHSLARALSPTCRTRRQIQISTPCGASIIGWE